MKKILIIYTSVGLGHKVVAENIAQSLRRHSGLEIKLLDNLKFYKGLLVGISEKIYVFIINYLPGLWRFFYTNKLFNRLTLPLRLPVAAIKAEKMNQYLKKEKPDLVLTTQTTATAVISYLKKTGKYQGKLVAAFSDYHFQPYWHYPRVDHYLVIIPEQKEELIQLGQPPEQITVTSLPVDEEYTQEYGAGEVYKDFELSRAKPLVLVMGGSRGWGISVRQVRELIRTELDIQLVIVTGTDQALRNKLLRQTKGANLPMKVYGYLGTTDLARLFSIARLLITKPGGLTVGQALVNQLPMVLTNPIPAGEEMNQEYLISRQAAVKAEGTREVRAWMERLLRDQELAGRLKQGMAELSHPDAAGASARRIVDML